MNAIGKNASKNRTFQNSEKNIEQPIKEIFNMYARDDSHIKLSETLFLLLEKNMFKNKYSLDCGVQLYYSIVNEEIEMDFTHFLQFFEIAAKKFFSQSKNPNQEMLNVFGNEKVLFKNWKGILKRRVPDIFSGRYS